ncbi:MAG: hypothetical protein ACRDBR_01615 [Metamycoplasmataceae bacterium]
MCGIVKCANCPAKICRENLDKEICPCSEMNGNKCVCKEKTCGPE